MQPTSVPSSKSEFICKEIYTTEQAYQDSMRILSEVIAAELEAHPNPELQRIMQPYAEIAAIGFKGLEARNTEGVTKALPQIAAAALKPTTNITTHYEEILKYFARNPKILQRINDRLGQMPEANGLKLDAFLIKPIQRFPRYNLLTLDLLNHTSTDNPLYSDTAALLQNLKEKTSEINEAKRNAELYGSPLIAATIIKYGIMVPSPSDDTIKVNTNLSEEEQKKYIAQYKEQYVKQAQREIATAIMGGDINKIIKTLKNYNATIQEQPGEKPVTIDEKRATEIAQDYKQRVYYQQIHPDLSSKIFDLMHDEHGNLIALHAQKSELFHKSTTLHLIGELNSAYTKYRSDKKAARKPEELAADIKKIETLLQRLSLSEQQAQAVFKSMKDDLFKTVKELMNPVLADALSKAQVTIHVDKSCLDNSTKWSSQFRTSTTQFLIQKVEVAHSNGDTAAMRKYLPMLGLNEVQIAQTMWNLEGNFRKSITAEEAIKLAQESTKLNDLDKTREYLKYIDLYAKNGKGIRYLDTLATIANRHLQTAHEKTGQEREQETKKAKIYIATIDPKPGAYERFTGHTTPTQSASTPTYKG